MKDSPAGERLAFLPALSSRPVRTQFVLQTARLIPPGIYNSDALSAPPAHLPGLPTAAPPPADALLSRWLPSPPGLSGMPARAWSPASLAFIGDAVWEARWGVGVSPSAPPQSRTRGCRRSRYCWNSCGVAGGRGKRARYRTDALEALRSLWCSHAQLYARRLYFSPAKLHSTYVTKVSMVCRAEAQARARAR